MGLYHSSDRPETGTLRAIFIAPTKLKIFYPLPFIVSPGNRKVSGDFRRPYEKNDLGIGGGGFFGGGRMGEKDV